jgi:phosphonate transport system ATP-binding protein
MEVRFDDVTVAFGELMALDRLTLEIPTGQFCAILGGSGAGKSSLLRCVSGLGHLKTGHVTIDGIAPSAALRRQIGVIPQAFGLSGRARVATNVMAVQASHGPLWRALTGRYRAADRERATSLLAALDLEEGQLARRTDALSGGQQQRVAIARALLPAPLLILADEPVASLDPATAERALTVLREEARRSGTTILCTLHQPELARRFADRVITIDRGTIVETVPGHDAGMRRVQA